MVIVSLSSLDPKLKVSSSIQLEFEGMLEYIIFMQYLIAKVKHSIQTLLYHMSFDAHMTPVIPFIPPILISLIKLERVMLGIQLILQLFTYKLTCH